LRDDLARGVLLAIGFLALTARRRQLVVAPSTGPQWQATSIHRDAHDDKKTEPRGKSQEPRDEKGGFLPGNSGFAGRPLGSRRSLASNILTISASGALLSSISTTALGETESPGKTDVGKNRDLCRHAVPVMTLVAPGRALAAGSPSSWHGPGKIKSIALGQIVIES